MGLSQGNDACATLRAESTYFNLYNINVANTYGSGKQATALSAHNSHQGYYGCSMTGYQANTSLLILVMTGR